MTSPLSLQRLLLVGLGLTLAVALAAPPLVALLPFPAAVALGGMATFTAGVALAIRLRSGALFALGLFGLFAFVAAAAESQIWLRFQVGAPVVLDSVAAAAQHPAASRLSFPESVARMDLVGEARSSIARSAGPPVELSAFAVPLVPADWQRGQSVAAWLVCEQARSETATPCGSQMPARLTQAIRATPRPEAAQAAIAQHGLTSVADPAFLAPASGGALDRIGAALMLLAWPAVAWLAWAVGVFVYRVVPAKR
ncbi:hypothetical protein ACLF3G_01430 [Falsiroseomonas sp. HC035]|uniref:hypothetical protein n=1 Tax=Falsiroseomonas sp. HC035 TaxID=3390999 RepID=UPI003D31F57E